SLTLSPSFHHRQSRRAHSPGRRRRRLRVATDVSVPPLIARARWWAARLPVRPWRSRQRR
ncbi:hypothetical protein B296_00058503, partial [Ensete ventricosum]